MMKIQSIKSQTMATKITAKAISVSVMFDYFQVLVIMAIKRFMSLMKLAFSHHQTRSPTPSPSGVGLVCGKERRPCAFFQFKQNNTGIKYSLSNDTIADLASIKGLPDPWTFAPSIM